MVLYNIFTLVGCLDTSIKAKYLEGAGSKLLFNILHDGGVEGNEHTSLDPLLKQKREQSMP